MTDFRKADISKQESYDLLRDWIKLVARHTNPDQDISELLGWLWKLKPATPDPITGLVPCGCGGEVYPHFQFGWTHEESGVQAFEVSTGCDGCGTYTKSRRGHYVNGIDEVDTESASKRDWNISRGYTEPPRTGAIGPGTGEMDPNGDEGAE